MDGLSIRERLRRHGLAADGPAGPPLAAPPPLDVPGEEVRTPEGSFILRTKRLPGSWLHGDLPLDAAREGREAVAALTRQAGYAAVRPRDRLYLDTETTGLFCGAGALVFLIGVGSFEGESFVVRQHLMRDPSEERAMLRSVGMLLERAGALVTFCGRSFDAPRTRDRFALQDWRHLEQRLREICHVDLYHAARRLFRHRLPDCRLRTLEREVLGFRRMDDLPGAACPRAWFRYQRGLENLMPDILDHNLNDILSLAALEAQLAAHGASHQPRCTRGNDAARTGRRRGMAPGDGAVSGRGPGGHPRA